MFRSGGSNKASPCGGDFGMEAELPIVMSSIFVKIHSYVKYFIVMSSIFWHGSCKGCHPIVMSSILPTHG